MAVEEMTVSEMIKILSELNPNGKLQITDPASLYYDYYNEETGKMESKEIMSY